MVGGKRYRVRNDYAALKVFDPYSIIILLALREGDMNISRINHVAAKYADITLLTTSVKLKKLVEHGLVELKKTKRVAAFKEKIYGLTEKGKILADAFARFLNSVIEEG